MVGTDESTELWRHPNDGGHCLRLLSSRFVSPRNCVRRTIFKYLSDLSCLHFV